MLNIGEFGVFPVKRLRSQKCYKITVFCICNAKTILFNERPYSRPSSNK